MTPRQQLINDIAAVMLQGYSWDRAMTRLDTATRATLETLWRENTEKECVKFMRDTNRAAGRSRDNRYCIETLSYVTPEGRTARCLIYPVPLTATETP